MIKELIVHAGAVCKNIDADPRSLLACGFDESADPNGAGGACEPERRAFRMHPLDPTAPTWSATRKLPGALLLLSITVWSTAAGAVEPWSDERLVLRAGAVFMDIDSSFRVDSRSLGQGTTVDGEEDLGLDDDDRVFRAELSWRFARRHRLELGYFDLSRDAGAVTSEPIRIGNVTFPPGIEVLTDFDLRLADLSYSYSLIQNERLELAPLIGVFSLDWDVRVRSRTPDLQEQEGETFPLPTLGVRGTYRLTHAWRLRAGAQYFYIDYDDYEGDMFDLGAGLEWKLGRRLSLGGGYSRLEFDIEDKSPGGGRGEYEYDGLWLYVALLL